MKKAPGAFLRSIAAAMTAGIALWVSRASFDVAGTTAAPQRVAMLPSTAELLGLVVMALLLAAGIATLQRRDRPLSEPFWDAAGDALLPLFGLAVLAVPYLPFVADWIPALRLLAGPGRVVVWIIVIGQVIWILLPRFDASTASRIFACAAVFLSAPFVMNVRATPAALGDLFGAMRSLPSADWSRMPAGSLGALFDQEYGVVAYAPVLLLALVGLAGMIRERSQRKVAIMLAAPMLLLVVLPGSVDPWWSKSMLPGRPLLLLLPLLAFPIAWLYERLPEDSFARAIAQVLLLTSLAVTAVFVVSSGRVPARQEGDGMSALLYWASPTWHLWIGIPSYVASSTGAATLRVLVWLGVFGAAAAILWRRRPASAGSGALLTTVGTIGTFIAVATLTAATGPAGAKRFDVEGRVMFPLLETFDPVARPMAVRYAPFSIAGPDDLAPMFTASAVPGARTDPQPLRVVLNARFRLPAGEYELDLTGTESAGAVSKGSIALQIGRDGRPVQAWPLTLVPGGRVRIRFELPLDAEFVGFRASRQVEQAIAELRVRALHVIGSRRRFRTRPVLSAAAFGPWTMFFHDGNAYAESDGFWVKGRATASMTLRKTPDAATGVTLAVHSGARPNVVTVSAPGWSRKLELTPGVTERVMIPAGASGEFVPLSIAAASGFVPAEIDSSRDRRLLGAWIALIPDDISRTSATP